MSGRYLTDLADVCQAAGLNVIRVDGWQTRAKSSGGYSSGRPTHVMVHHTASGPSSDGWPDVNYQCYTSENKPTANLYLDRSGTVYVMAAGATNTNGKGHDSWGGGVPDDSMNSYAIGIEAGNNGVGEPWPQAQQQAYLRLCDALCAYYAIPYNFVRGHCEWAPGRKIDPAGPSAWAQGSATWDMNAFRRSVVDFTPDPQPPQPIPDEEEDMAFIIINQDTGQPALVYGDGKVTGIDGGSYNTFVAKFGPAITVEAVTFADFQSKGG